MRRVYSRYLFLKLIADDGWAGFVEEEAVVVVR